MLRHLYISFPVVLREFLHQYDPIDHGLSVVLQMLKGDSFPLLFWQLHLSNHRIGDVGLIKRKNLTTSEKMLVVRFC